MSAHLPLALTMGDPAGIGPELAWKVYAQRNAATRPFFVIADHAQLAALARALNITVPLEACDPRDAAGVFARALPVVPLKAAFTATPGHPSPANAAAVIESIERAVAYVRAGEAGAVVTNPIAKEVLYNAGFKHPGHTEFLGALARRWWGGPGDAVMMLWSPDLAVVPVTVHIALKDVPTALTTQRIVATARITAADLTNRFGVANPRLAIAGLNPHAGEGGAMGREDIEIVAPAVAQLKAEGIHATGPHPADTLFHAAARARYDAALCMYHDQALIPLKTLAFDSGVNVTLGLPFIRTSPDHGTAFDIAGKGLANPASLLAALALAARLADGPA